ncbi:hypothetical protein L208DRAFT_1409986 [Tricholoma matsutake]|nr:hypothetical protein L208DRAFT_1409986 [Tricholoma matsutake 945]
MYTPGHAPKSALHARTGSTSSLSRQLSRTHANSSNPDPNPPITLLTHMYLLPSSQPHVPCLRTTLLGGVCPCVACRLARGIHCQLLGVWARRRHWRSGHWGFVPALAVMGQDHAGKDLRAMEMKEGGYGRYGAGFVDMRGNKRKEKEKTTRKTQPLPKKARVSTTRRMTEM